MLGSESIESTIRRVEITSGVSHVFSMSSKGGQVTDNIAGCGQTVQRVGAVRPCEMRFNTA